MTDTLRDRIVQVQAEHVEGQLTNYDADGREECGCGHQGNATYREHLADAILAIPGIAVVELPKPAGAVRCWPALVGGEPESVYQARDEIVVSGGLRLYVDEARDIAAALLACSVKRNGKDGRQSASPTFSPKPNSDARRKTATSERT